jgi:hypothetical protein
MFGLNSAAKVSMALLLLRSCSEILKKRTQRTDILPLQTFQHYDLAAIVGQEIYISGHDIVARCKEYSFIHSINLSFFHSH